MQSTMRAYIIALLLSAPISHTCCTESFLVLDHPQHIGYALVAGILLGTIPLKTLWKQPDAFPFAELSEDTRGHIISLIIIGATNRTVHGATTAINELAQINQEFNELINNPHYLALLITELAKRCSCTEKDVAQEQKNH